MVSGAIRFFLAGILLCLLVSTSFAQECPTCANFQSKPYAKVLMSVDDTNHIATITVSYENTSNSPSLLPVNDSIIIVELTNSSGFQPHIYKTYTLDNGVATFDFSPWSGACMNIKALYCPFCNGASSTCGFQQCLAFAEIHNDSNYYENVIPAGSQILSADNIPVWGSAFTSPLSTQEYFPDVATVTYCPPPTPSSQTPPLCLPLLIIFSLLSGALYLTGKNPFSSFNIGGARTGRHIRYQARGRGFSMNVQSVATAVSSVGQVVKDAKEGKIGANWKEQAKNSSPANLLPLSGIAGAVDAVGAIRAGAQEGKGKGFVQGVRAGGFMISNSMDQRHDARTKGTAAKAGPTTVAGGMVLPGGNRQTMRASDFMAGATGKGGERSSYLGDTLKTFGNAFAYAWTQSSIMRVVDGFKGWSGGSLVGDYLKDRGAYAVRASNDQQMIQKATGPGLTPHTDSLRVAMPGGDALLVSTTQIVTKNKETGVTEVTGKDYVFRVAESAGGPSKEAGASFHTVTVHVAAEKDANGNPVMKDISNLKINGHEVILSSQTVPKTEPVMDPKTNQPQRDAQGNIVTKTTDQQIPVFLVPDSEGKKMVAANVDFDHGTVTVGGKPVDIGLGKGEALGVKDGKLISYEPQMKVESVTTTATANVGGTPTNVSTTMYVGTSVETKDGTKITHLAGTTETVAAVMDANGRPAVDAKGNPVPPAEFAKVQLDFERDARSVATASVGMKIPPAEDKAQDAAKTIAVGTADSLFALNSAVASYKQNLGADMEAGRSKMEAEIKADPVAKADYESKRKEVAEKALGEAIAIPAFRMQAGAETPTDILLKNVQGGAAGATWVVDNALLGSVLVNPRNVPSGSGDNSQRRADQSSETMADTTKDIAKKANLAPEDSVGAAIVIRGLTGNGGSSLADINKMTPDQAKTLATTEITNAYNRGDISAAQRDTYINTPALVTTAYTEVTSAAKKATDAIVTGTSSTFGSEMAHVPIADLAKFGAVSDAVTTGMAGYKRDPTGINFGVYEQTGNVPPSLRADMNIWEQTKTSLVASEQAGAILGSGVFNEAAAARVEIGSKRFDEYARATTAAAAMNADVDPAANLPPGSTQQTKNFATDHYVATMDRFEDYSMTAGNSARNERAMLEMDRNLERSDFSSANPFAVSQNNHQAEFVSALNTASMDNPQVLRQAIDTAHEAANECRKAGDTRGAEAWELQTIGLSGVYRDMIGHGISPENRASEPIMGGAFPADTFKGQTGEGGAQNRWETYKGTIDQARSDVASGTGFGVPQDEQAPPLPQIGAYAAGRAQENMYHEDVEAKTHFATAVTNIEAINNGTYDPSKPPIPESATSIRVGGGGSEPPKPPDKDIASASPKPKGKGPPGGENT